MNARAACPVAGRAVLTGATGGIGRAIAHQLAPQAESLLLLGRNSQALNSLRKELLEKYPLLSVGCLAGDLNDTAYQKEIASFAAENNSNLLVNNAGINQFGAAARQSQAEQSRIIQTNLLAPMLLTQALLPTLLKQPQAQVVYVGSILGYIGYPGNAAYCASKFGLRGYAQAMKRELANTSVQVKYLAPRATATSINTAAVNSLNSELGSSTDTPAAVASAFMQLLLSNRFDLKLGFPERLFVFLNQLFPRVNDAAIRKQLPVIEKHWSA
ncbi:MAG TPA: SDR family oxidoreductase [Limnobacter sp.]|nr:SDR family oxidoreductase [Limnobacter sp.]